MTDNYSALRRILDGALSQASDGKGAERHSMGEPFELQPIVANARRCGLGGPVYQILKKADEALRLPPGRAIEELRGVIVYAAACVLILEDEIRDDAPPMRGHVDDGAIPDSVVLSPEPDPILAGTLWDSAKPDIASCLREVVSVDDEWVRYRWTHDNGSTYTCSRTIASFLASFKPAKSEVA